MVTMNKSWIRVAEFVTLGALLFAPMSLLFIDHQLLFPYISSKNFIWRILITIATTSWVTLVLMDVRYRISWRNPLVLVFGLFMISILVSNITGIDSYRSFWSNAERMDGYIGLGYLFAYFLVLTSMLRAQVVEQSINYARMLWLGAGVLAIALTYQSSLSLALGDWAPLLVLSYIAVGWWVMHLANDNESLGKVVFHGLLSIGVWLGVIAFFQDKTRADSIIGNPIYLASYAVFSIFIATYYLGQVFRLGKTQSQAIVTYILLIVFFMLVLFQTGTRGALLGLGVGGVVASVLTLVQVREAQYRYFRYLAITILGITVVGIAAFVGLRQTVLESDFFEKGSLVQRVAKISLEDRTTKHRLVNWDQAIDGWQERPLFGWGQENYIHVFSKYYQANKMYDGEQWFDRAHNMFLDWLVFGGLFGLILFVAIIAASLYVLWHHDNRSFDPMARIVLTGAIVAYMVQNFFAFDALPTAIWFISILAFIAASHPEQTSKSTNPVVIKQSVVIIATLGLCISSVVWLHYSVFQPRTSMHLYMTMMRTTPQITDVATAHERLDTLLAYDNLFTQEYLEQLLSRPSIYLNENIDADIRNYYAERTIIRSQEFVEENPHITRVSLFLGDLLQKTGNYELAELYFKQALSTSPDKIHILWLLAQNSVAQGNVELGITYLEQAAALAPDYQATQDALLQLQSDYASSQ